MEAGKKQGPYTHAASGEKRGNQNLTISGLHQGLNPHDRKPSSPKGGLLSGKSNNAEYHKTVVPRRREKKGKDHCPNLKSESRGAEMAKGSQAANAPVKTGHRGIIPATQTEEKTGKTRGFTRGKRLNGLRSCSIIEGEEWQGGGVYLPA